MNTNDEIRLIDEAGKQLGVVSLAEAKKIAQDHNLDLVLITAKVKPPIYKLGDLEKFRYAQEKKYKKQKLRERQRVAKIIRLGFNEGIHDLQIKAKKAQEFLESGYSITIEMRLRGREKAHEDIAQQKITDFLTAILTPYTLIQPLTKTPSGFTMSLKK